MEQSRFNSWESTLIQVLSDGKRPSYHKVVICGTVEKAREQQHLVKKMVNEFLNRFLILWIKYNRPLIYFERGEEWKLYR